MLRPVWNKSLKEHPAKQLLYGYQLPYPQPLIYDEEVKWNTAEEARMKI